MKIFYFNIYYTSFQPALKEFCREIHKKKRRIPGVFPY